MPISNTQLAIRWPAPALSHIPLLQSANIELILLTEANPAFTQACGIPTSLVANEPGLVTSGLWPGFRRPARQGRDIEVASASREPWVDANSYLVEYHRALDPSKPAILAQPAPQDPSVEIPYDTVELALIEARVAGGNFILDLPHRYREALRANNPRALAAWQSLAKTAAWLKQNAALFGRPALPNITALVDPSPQSREIANLLHRRGCSPSLAAQPPAPSKQILALVAAGLRQVPPAALAHAEAGAILVLDSPPPPAAKLTRQEADRAFYSFGAGSIVAYRKRIVDPSEFALDVIDLIGHKRRSTRLWNASAAIPLATRGESPNEALLHIVNYASPNDEETQAHIQGRFTKATLLTPDHPPKPLAVSPRGSSSEVFVPALKRLAIVRFSN